MIRHTLISIAFTLFAATALANEWVTAVEKGDVPALAKLFEADPVKAQTFGPYMWRDAALLGHTNVLSWLHASKITGSEALLDDGKSIWHSACRLKRLAVVIWLIENKISGQIDAQGIDSWALAAGYDFIELLEWLRENKIPIHLGGIYILRSAISNSRADVLKWLYENNIVPFDITTEDLRNFWLFAATFDHTETLDWAETVKLPGRAERDFEGNDVWALATIFGNLNVLKWLNDHDPDGLTASRRRIRKLAKQHDQRHILAWLDAPQPRPLRAMQPPAPEVQVLDETQDTHANLRNLITNMAQGLSRGGF